MPSAETTLERSMFVGLIFTSILYGTYVTLYFLSCRLLWKQPQPQSKFYVVYSSALLLFLTVSVATNCAFGDLMWIDERDVTGGPPAYYAENASAWYNTFGTAADMTAFAMADGLLASLMFECFVFWRDHRWTIILPAMIYISSVVMAIMMTIEGAVPGANIFQGLPTSFAIPWTALTVSFNIKTMMIVGRLLLSYWTVRDSLNPGFSATYLDVSATLVESALPFSALGIGYAISIAMGSNVAAAFAFVWGTFAALAPQLIIYRVALGVAWTKDTMLTTEVAVHFATNPDYELNGEKTEKHPSGAGGSAFNDTSNIDLSDGKV